jgi:hypothetical protein
MWWSSPATETVRSVLGALVFIQFFGTASAQLPDEPHTVYLKLHRATLVQNLNEMLLYSSDASQAELKNFAGDPQRLKLVSAMMPRVYTVRATSVSSDGARARLRATGSFTFQSTTAPSYGTVDLVKQGGEWRVDKFEWSGDKPQGFDEAIAQARVAARLAAGQPAAPAEEPAQKPPAVAEEPRPEPVARTPRRECEIKPVMTDDDLRACGSRIPE